MIFDTRSNHEAFICKHISNQLLTEGYPPIEVQKATTAALRFYRSSAKFAQNKVFDGCLAKARTMLVPLKKVVTKTAKKGSSNGKK